MGCFDEGDRCTARDFVGGAAAAADRRRRRSDGLPGRAHAVGQVRQAGPRAIDAQEHNLKHAAEALLHLAAFAAERRVRLLYAA